jgi:hypothetical protein
MNLVKTFQKRYTYIELFFCIILRNFNDLRWKDTWNLHCRVYCRHVIRLFVCDWWISNGYTIWFMDRKKFIKTSPEWHQYLKLRYGFCHFFGVKSSWMLVLVVVILSLFLYEFGSNFPEKIYIYWIILMYNSMKFQWLAVKIYVRILV